ncbi:type IV pilus secretin PilQ [Methylogaea oryzae]|uniref:Fimbrial assembly protein PilQ n=1 Tax=Methylogaea oryzae TaxID=1295382 RepID=A0A8D5ALB0_9GAMM|nr:type IV pilus secretin PilQ [Methylogaea oryzae]BBL72659.1 fimbrial assembly protein PilQ [Methylogaea oryzae]
MWVRKRFIDMACLFGLALFSLSAMSAEASRLESVNFTTLSGDQLRLDFTLSGPVAEPAVFHTDNPARIALDFPAVSNGLGNKAIPVDTGVARSVNAVEAQGRTRVVVNLLSMARYDVATEGGHVYLTLYGKAETPKGPAGKASASSRAGGGFQGQSVKNVDFQRGEKGEGRVLIALSDANAVADMRREGNQIVVYIPGASVPTELEKKLDVTDFATPVKNVTIQGETGRAKVVVTPVSEDYEYSSYQTDNTLTIEFRALSRAEREERQRKEVTYGGEKLTLNFQDIPVRQVLQILADFTGLNMVASDTVQGNVTLRLNDVPWDQALDIVLKSKGLAKRQDGGVVRIGPAAEVQKQEQDELAANQKVEELAPLITELIYVKYAKAADMLAILQGGVASKDTAKNEESTKTGGTETNSSRAAKGESILSERGSVAMDDRTNTLLVKDTALNIERVRQLVGKLDVPVRQLLIDSRIVIASDNFTRNLGMKFTQVSGGSGSSAANATGVTYGGNPSAGSSQAIMGSLFDLAAADPRAKIGFTVLRAAGSLLELELSAGQLEGTAETLSNPRLLASDGTKSFIKQGTAIPVQSGGSATTAPTIKYVEAVLLLEVTPHIAPDENVMLELKITKDAVGELVTTSSQAGITNQSPAIDKREIQTNVQVRDGDTVVLGGVYEDENSKDVDGVPFLSDIPYLGKAFQREATKNKKRELLVFVTPKIVRQNLAQTP